MLHFRRSFQLTLTLALSCLLTAPDATAQTAPPSSVGTVTRVFQPHYLPAIPIAPEDPTTDHDWNCYHFGTYIWNGVQARVDWPSPCGGGVQPPSTPLPLVMILHGDDHSHLDYNHLSSHLARSGFIVASVAQSGSNANRAQRARTMLSFLHNNWTFRDSLSGDVGLLGHSRGGEAVLTLAREIDTMGLPYDVRAVISLAPTDSAEGGGILEDLDGDESPSFLAIYGTHDEDVTNHCIAGNQPWCGNTTTSPKGNAFSIYDRAGVEHSTEPFVFQESLVTKAMLYVERANHNSFRNTCAGFPSFPELNCDTHHNLLKGYVAAWMRWWLRDQDLYKGYFDGSWGLQSIPNVTIHRQYQPGFDRRVVDNCENNDFSSNTIGGAVTAGFQSTTVVREGTGYDYEGTIPHDTGMMIVRYSSGGFVPFLRWYIPDTSGFFSGRRRDVREFEYLSFRAGQVYGAANNTPGLDADFLVELFDDSGQVSNSVRVARFAKLPYPETAVVVNQGVVLTTTASAMKTVRIPMTCFENVDMENIASIRFRFTVSGQSDGEIMLDNLEFTH